ncbi:HAUS augmin-like complex subunit 7 [Paramormyrops kingsleyae]|uniref:HAUS augmin like complex subunit 7 n=1 Tax=Paramormyrops kingsleyae TaxID=1676925 RepID=A0A3B3RZK8_9TELE|nr:HAUS augmin-like complex subunit 7 [Paramormyrops kingsleyae]
MSVWVRDRLCSSNMAGTLKEKQLSREIYDRLQGLGCPLVDGLYLREDESMRDLLCLPSLHRSDILKWICVSVCPSFKKKLSSLRSTETDAIDREIMEFVQELMLCKPGDLNLIKGQAPPLCQLLFLDQLISLIPSMPAEMASGFSSRTELGVAELVVRNEEFLSELLSSQHLEQLGQLLSPSCSPWTADVRELLHQSTAQCKASRGQSMTKSEDHPGSVEDLLHSTQSLLEDLQKECEFLQVASSPPLSPTALRVAISDLSQLMSTFSQAFNTDFRSYCNRSPPVLSPDTHTFQTVHRLLSGCNQELQAVLQLSDTCGAATQAVQQTLTVRRYWGDGHKHTLAARLEELKKRYSEYLSLCQ